MTQIDKEVIMTSSLVLFALPQGARWHCISICLIKLCIWGLKERCSHFALAGHRLLLRTVACLFGPELPAKDACCLLHHFQVGLLVSRGVGSVHALHILLFRSHKPFAVERSIGPTRMARRSCNCSSASCVGRAGVQWWDNAKEPV